jgi:hypothetical protein
MADLMQVSGLWKNKSANGEEYLQGKLSANVRILIFRNKYKTADNQPDYQMYFAPIEREGQSGGADFPGEGEAQDAPQAAAQPRRAPAGGYSARRTTPEPPSDYDDMGDIADPFAE